MLSKYFKVIRENSTLLEPSKDYFSFVALYPAGFNVKITKTSHLSIQIFKYRVVLWDKTKVTYKDARVKGC